jgi:hypothetical protein
VIAARHRLKEFGCVGLLLLIACTLYLDLFHGLRLGQDQIAYSPIYRFRESLAIAISRLHDPSPGGYLAYKSVVTVFNENGFALRGEDLGSHLEVDGWRSLLNDGPRLDRIIREARDVAVDRGLSPEVIQGNELGLADYMYFSFRLFGDNISSFYYFLFLIVLLTCLFYVLQFRNSPFLLFLLVIFLSELYFLENYANSYGLELNTIHNSRLYSGLSLLPVLHVLIVLWRREPPRALTVATVVAQSMLFAFLLSCRTEAAWQVAMMVAVTCGMGLYLLLTRRALEYRHSIGWLAPLWPVAIFFIVLSAYSAVTSSSADKRYAMEPEGHIIWHEVLQGILGSSPELMKEYVGRASAEYTDSEVYEAVIRDLNARNDASSPIVRRLDNGQLTIDLWVGWGEYDRLVKSLTLKIILHHPLAVLEGLKVKFRDQIAMFDNRGRHSMSWENLRLPMLVVAVGAFICMLAGGLSVSPSKLGNAAILVGIVLLFAAVTPVIEPSSLSIGTLFAYLGAFAIALSYLVARMIQSVTGVESKIERTTLGVKSPQ